MLTTLMRYTPEEWTAARPSREWLAHYITFYPQQLSEHICSQLVSRFDAEPARQIERCQGGGHFRFQQTDVTKAAHENTDWHYLHTAAFRALESGVFRYRRDTHYDDTPRFPPQFGYEHLRINRTLNNGRDGFGNHVDVGDHASARRFLTLLFYLTTVEEGGDAAFPGLDIALKPTTGALLCFPSNWVYLHCGLKPLSHPKYIMTSFLHYY